MDNKSLKENIYKRRKELGLSQECVAEQVDISLNAYIKLEKGPTKIFNPKIIKIAEALETTPEALILGSVIKLTKHNEICENLKQYYNVRMEEYREMMKDKNLLIRRLNKMVTDKEHTISQLKETLGRLQKNTGNPE